MGFGEDRESIFQVVKVRRKVMGPLADSWRLWRSIAALFCAFGGLKEAWGAWSSSKTLVGETMALSRFYEAVVELPLQKARALDPAEDAINEQIDPNRRQAALALREQCYEVVMNALRSLKGEPSHKRLHTEFGSPVRHTASRPLLDQASQERYIRQIIQLSVRWPELSVRWPDQAFHEYLYRTMIELGLENELLELVGPDLVPFLQSASREQSKSGNLIFKSAMPSAPSSMTRTRQAVNLEQAKYLELLAHYYVYKRQHVLAAHVLLRLSERRQVESGEMLTLEQRSIVHNLSYKTMTTMTKKESPPIEIPRPMVTIMGRYEGRKFNSSSR